MAGERSVDARELDNGLREGSNVSKSEEEARKREAVTRKECQILKRGVNLVMDREGCLTDFHRLQAKFSNSRSGDSRFDELRATLAERESALLKARGYAAELQQMYRETRRAREAAESRVRELEGKLERRAPPLVIVSPSASQCDSAPFLAEPKPMTKMSAEDEVVIARLLSAIERLRSERDTLRRDLHFAGVEHRFADDALRARLEATENELRRLRKEVTKGHQDRETSPDSVNEERTLSYALEDPYHEVECAGNESTGGVTSSTDNNETQTLRVPLQRLEDNDSQHLRSEYNLSQTCHNVPKSQQCDEGDRRLTEALAAEQILRAELAASHAHIADAVKAVEQRDIRLEEMRARLTEFEIHVSKLQRELLESRSEVGNGEARHSERQLSELSPADNEAAEVSKSQLEVLEQRVLRRTEQIGMLQHDTKRLETNLRVAEETIGELTAELETLTQERACLLEDCAQARETRDEAHRKVEKLEIEMETHNSKNRLELDGMKTVLQDAQAEVATNSASLKKLVLVIAESVKRSRTLSVVLVQTKSRLATAEANVSLAEDARLDALSEVERLSSQLESDSLTIRNQTADIETLTQELVSVRAEMQQKLLVCASLEKEAQTHERDIIVQRRNLSAKVETLEGQLAVTQATKDQLLRELEIARLNEKDAQAQLENAQTESQKTSETSEGLIMTVAFLKQTLDKERSSHLGATTQAQKIFERQMSGLEAELEESRQRVVWCQAEHADVIHDLTLRLDETKSRLAEANEGAKYGKSLESQLCMLKSEHADAVGKLRSQVDESSREIESHWAQLHSTREAFADLESQLKASVGQYDTAQVEIRRLEQALASARTHLDEHEASIDVLQRERTSYQFEQVRLEAELEKLTIKHQYVEQQAKRSDKEIMRLKSEVERLCGEVVKFDEAAQTAEIHLSFKTNQFDQKLAMMQRELEKQQSHRQCQENLAELNSKNEYLEEMLRMKSAEIEENDDRFIEALKEKKRLTSKVESLSRKVQGLLMKLEAITPPSTTIPASAVSIPKTPSLPVPSAQSTAGPSARPPSRIPSSPAAALRTRTPELSRRAFTSKIATPEPGVPPGTPQNTSKNALISNPASHVDLHQTIGVATVTSQVALTLSSASDGGKKRRAPDDFDSPVALPAQAIIVSDDNSTPRVLRRFTNESRSRFTPTRVSVTKPMQTASRPSPLRRNAAPLAEATNSPRGGRQIGLGKPPIRGWLSRTRAPTTSGDTGGILG